MNRASSSAPIAPGRDEMRDERGVVAGLCWMAGWVAAIVAVVVASASAASAIKLAGVPDPGWITTYGLPVVTGVGQFSAAIALGSAVFAAFFVPAQADGVFDIGGYRAMRISSVAALIWGVCGLLGVPLAISDVSGETFANSVKPDNLVNAYGQVAGAQTWLWTAIFALLAAVLARVVWRWGWSIGVIMLVTLSLMPSALAGHSSSGGDHDLATNSLILHIVGAAVWTGGLFAVLAYALARGRWRVLAVRRFSRVAFWCVVVVGATGVLNALTRVPVGDLLDTTYGRLILGKIAAFVVLAGLGAWHRCRTIAELEAQGDAESDAPWWKSMFVRFGAVELAVFAATFGLAAGLSRTPPPPVDTASISPVELKIGYQISEPPNVARILFDWRFDLIFGTLAIILAAVYLRGVVRLRRRGDEWPIGRTIAWILGCVLLLLATSSGLGRYSPAMFSVHMVSHMMLSMMVPVLLVLGGPVTLALRALAPAGKDNPAGPREWILTGIHSPWGRIATHPLVAAVIFVGSFYVLYLGGLFETVVEYHAAHLLMNLHFLVSGYVFYWLVIGIDPAPRQVSPVAKLGIVWGSLPFHAFFGVALMMTSSVIAERYYRGLLLPWRYDLFDDQRIGGGVAWAFGEIPLVVIMLALLVQWQRSDERAARRYDRQADRDQDADLDDYNEMLKSLNGRR